MRLVDLSVTISEDSIFEKAPPTIKRITHEGEGLERMKAFFGVRPEDLVWSGGLGWASDEVTMSVHTGTHVDAPYHYGPTSGGEPAMTIDQVPLEWCFGDGVVLDFTFKEGGELITAEDVQGALNAIDYEIKPFDIVLIRTGRSEKSDPEEYFNQPGLDRSAVLWLVDRGVKVIGIDAWGLDTDFKAMAEAFARTGDGRIVWQAHFAGISRPYLQIERMCNLHLLPPYGFQVACFPIKIAGASGGWTRAVAFLSDDE